MSHVESKAKTFEALYHSAKIPWGVSFVTLDDAKKLETDLKDSTAQLEDDSILIEKMQSKIAEANKILEEIEGDPNLYKYWKTDFERLRGLLK